MLNTSADLLHLDQECSGLHQADALSAADRFNPPEHFARFQLAEGLFYNNAWENAASAMEVAAIEVSMA